jgi:hypothetical protein
MSFTENQRIVIRGIMKTFGPNDRGERGGIAKKINEALESFVKEQRSIVVYPPGSYETQFRFSDWINYDDEWWICGRCRSNRNRGYTRESLDAFLESRFRWAKAADASGFKNAVESQVNERFPGTWKVHLVKLEPGLGWTSYCYGARLNHDGYDLCVMESD